MLEFLLVVVLFSAMGRFRKAICGTIKKITGSSSKHSHGSSSLCYTEREETTPMEEQEQEQGQPMEEDDEPHLDLERGQEMEAYNLIKNRVFDHTLLYDPALL